MSLALHLAASLGKKTTKKKARKRLYRFGQRQAESFISSNTEKHIKGSEPQRSIVAAGNPLSRCPLCLRCAEANGQMWRRVMIANLRNVFISSTSSFECKAKT